MGIIDRIVQLYNKKEITFTNPSSTQETNTYFINRPRNADAIQRYQDVYAKGGVVKQIIDTYPNFILSNCLNGLVFVGENEEQVEYLTEVMTGSYTLFYQMFLDAVALGDSFSEIIWNADGTYNTVVPKNVKYFDVVKDKRGKFVSYIQYNHDLSAHISIPESNILHLRADYLTEDFFGISLIGMAYDDIVRFVDIISGTSSGIKRHGTPKFDISVGSIENLPDQQIMQKIADKYRNVSSATEFIHDAGIVVQELDSGGISSAEAYNKIAILNLCSALGVPQEIVGISVERSYAASRVSALEFSKRIAPIGKRFNDQLYEQLFKPILMQKFDSADPVHIDFGDIATMSLTESAEIVGKLMTNPMNPELIITVDEARGFLNLPPREDDDYDIIDEPEDEDGEE